jgi:dGTPase
LNLTVEVRDGIVKHSKGKGDIFVKSENEKPLTMEAELVRIADVIAYTNHDIDDALRGNVITVSDLPQTCRTYLGESHSKRIDVMVRSVIDHTMTTGHVGVREDIEKYIVELREFLYERVYDNPLVHAEFIKCSRIIEDLYRYFLDHPEDFLEESGYPDFYDDGSTCVCDYIAGMTDRYAFYLFEKIFLPMPWKIPV